MKINFAWNFLIIFNEGFNAKKVFFFLLMKLPTGFVRQNHFLTVKSVRNFDTSNLIVPPLCVLRRINQFLHPGVLRSCRPVCVDLAVRSASASLSLPRNFQPKTRKYYASCSFFFIGFVGGGDLVSNIFHSRVCDFLCFWWMTLLVAFRFWLLCG